MIVSIKKEKKSEKIKKTKSKYKKVCCEKFMTKGKLCSSCPYMK